MTWTGVEITTETTGPRICTDGNRARDADPSMRGLNDLRVTRVLLEAG